MISSKKLLLSMSCVLLIAVCEGNDEFSVTNSYVISESNKCQYDVAEAKKLLESKGYIVTKKPNDNGYEIISEDENFILKRKEDGSLVIKGKAKNATDN